MDSEQLVANPFQDMQQDAVNEAQKKSTMTERLTSVKNNVCENHFLMAQGRLDRQKTRRLKQLHDHSNKLRHEVKLLDLDRQRHTVEIKKRLMPERDFSYDDMQIVNTERRLGANIASFYLDKKMKYPTRIRSVSDISVTPTIRKARASIREQQMQKSMDEYATASRQERAATAKTSSSLQKVSSGIARRRDSRSAPAYTRNTRFGIGSKQNSSTTLPAIDQENRRDAWTSGDAKSAGNQQQQSPQHVKFIFENPLKILASNEESANLFAKSHPYYPGMVRAVNFHSDSSDDDDDDHYPSESELIDLKAVLFGTEGRSASLPSSQQSFTHQQLAALRKAQGPAPKLTLDMKQEEANYINAKINTFLENLAISRVRTRRDSDDIFSDLDSSEDLYKSTEKPNQFKSTSNAMTSTRESFDPKTNSNAKSISTSDSYAQKSNSQNKSSQNSNQLTSTGVNTTNNVASSTSTNAKNANLKNNDNNKDTTPNEYDTGDTTNVDTPRETKYSWRCIRGRQPDGALRGAYSSEDLVLQALTGVPISNMLSGHVPLHSASRAMRHTATFKMHKIVEKLIHERTKWERHQVEEIKKQMETGEQAAPSQPARKISSSSIGSSSSRVAAK